MGLEVQNIFITGCNRPNGIGFMLVKAFLEKINPTHLFATVRNAEKADELQLLAKKHPNLHILELDVANTDKYPSMAAKVNMITLGEGINLLINNAGIFDRPQDSLDQITSESFLTALKVNTVAPIMLTKALLPLLEKKSGLKAVINISTKMASIQDNTSGGSYLYRSSKTALNMATKSMSMELIKKGIITLLIHPGWVQTDMGGPNGLITVQESVDGIMKVLEELKEEQNGKFLQFDGQEVPW